MEPDPKRRKEDEYVGEFVGATHAAYGGMPMQSVPMYSGAIPAYAGMPGNNFVPYTQGMGIPVAGVPGSLIGMNAGLNAGQTVVPGAVQGMQGVVGPGPNQAGGSQPSYGLNQDPPPMGPNDIVIPYVSDEDEDDGAQCEVISGEEEDYEGGEDDDDDGEPRCEIVDDEIKDSYYGYEMPQTESLGELYIVLHEQVPQRGTFEGPGYIANTLDTKIVGLYPREEVAQNAAEDYAIEHFDMKEGEEEIFDDVDWTVGYFRKCEGEQKAPHDRLRLEKLNIKAY